MNSYKPSDWKTGYKVMYRADIGERVGVSATVRGNAIISYKPKTILEGKVFTEKHTGEDIQLPIMLFEDAERAKSFGKMFIDSDWLSVWMVRYIPASPIVPGDIISLELGYYKPDEHDWFVDGTVFAEKVVLVRRVA